MYSSSLGHVRVDGYTVRNPKLISDHISGSGTGGLPGARNPERATSMYSRVVESG